MSSMPTPVATAGRGTSERTDTAWQSIIAVGECLSGGRLSTPQPASRLVAGRGTVLDLSICDRPPQPLRSMIDGIWSDDLREGARPEARRGDPLVRDRRAASALAGDQSPASAR